MAVSSSVFETCFTTWYGVLLSTARSYYQDVLTVIPSNAIYGINDDVRLKRHKVLTRIIGLLVLTYWRAWDYNTWYAPTVDECKQYLPLGSFMTDKTIACMLREADCHKLDIRPLLRAAGIRPLPDGIGVMQINGDGACNGIVFQVGRERRTDSAQTDITDINYQL